LGLDVLWIELEVRVEWMLGNSLIETKN
jgi:hypothetical protein